MKDLKPFTETTEDNFNLDNTEIYDQYGNTVGDISEMTTQEIIKFMEGKKSE